VASLVVNTFSPAFLEVLHHSLRHVGEILLPLLPWCSVSNPPLSLVSFLPPCSWDILRGRSIVTRDTRSVEYWIANEISSETRQNHSFWNTSPRQKPLCFTDQRFMATQMLSVSLEERSRTNSIHQLLHPQLFCKIVRYFCQTLYYAYLKRKPGVYNTDGAVCLYVKDCEYLSEREKLFCYTDTFYLPFPCSFKRCYQLMWILITIYNWNKNKDQNSLNKILFRNRIRS